MLKRLWPLFSVIAQDFKAHVAQETYVIVGNDAIIKCDIPSFVGDLVSAVSWHDNSGNAYHKDLGNLTPIGLGLDV